MIGASAVFLVLMLVGMGLARITFSAAEAAASGNDGISNVALWGFATLQAGLYFAQIGVFYFLLPANPVAHRLVGSTIHGHFLVEYVVVHGWC